MISWKGSQNDIADTKNHEPSPLIYIYIYIYIYIKLTFRTTKVVNINVTDLLFTVRELQRDMNCGRKFPILRRNLRLPSSG